MCVFTLGGGGYPHGTIRTTWLLSWGLRTAPASPFSKVRKVALCIKSIRLILGGGVPLPTRFSLILCLVQPMFCLFPEKGGTRLPLRGIDVPSRWQPSAPFHTTRLTSRVPERDSSSPPVLPPTSQCPSNLFICSHVRATSRKPRAIPRCARIVLIPGRQWRSPRPPRAC